MRQKSLPVDEVRCEPCEYPVKRQCFGLHDQYEVPCKSDRLFDCKRTCGNPLECGNHTCQAPCHIVTKVRDHRQVIVDPNDTPTEEAFENHNSLIPVNKAVQQTYKGVPDLTRIISHFQSKCKDSCIPCDLGCQRPRNPPCKHPCPLPCHPEECPPCDVLVRKFLITLNRSFTLSTTTTFYLAKIISNVASGIKVSNEQYAFYTLNILQGGIAGCTCDFRNNPTAYYKCLHKKGSLDHMQYHQTILFHNGTGEYPPLDMADSLLRGTPFRKYDFHRIITCCKSYHNDMLLRRMGFLILLLHIHTELSWF